MFAYCGNNPTNKIDQTGELGAWWQTALSVGAIVAGLALTATGVGGVAGAMLVSAGASSLIGGELSEANGGSYTAGWIGGGISGAICGGGAALAGNLFSLATDLVGPACLGKVAEAVGISYGTGVLGNAIGDLVTNAKDHKESDIGKVIGSACLKGISNVYAGIGCGMTTVVIPPSGPAISRSLGIFISVTAQAVSDGINTLFGRLTSKAPHKQSSRVAFEIQ